VKRISKCAICRVPIVKYDPDDNESFSHIEFTLPCGRVTIGTQNEPHLCARDVEQCLINNIPGLVGGNVCQAAILTAVEKDCARSLGPLIAAGLAVAELVDVAILYKSHDTLAIMCKHDDTGVSKVRQRVEEDACHREERIRLMDIIMDTVAHKVRQTERKERAVRAGWVGWSGRDNDWYFGDSGPYYLQHGLG
jgi:hypothetical protein